MNRYLLILAGACLTAQLRTAHATLIPLGDEFRVNTYTSHFMSQPAVAPLPSGGFVVAWRRIVAPSPVGIFARLFDAEGTPIGGESEFQVNAYTYTGNPAIAVDANGDFIIVWVRVGPTSPETAILGRRFDSAGRFLGSELQVNTGTSWSQRNPAVAAAPRSGFFVVWQSEEPQGSDSEILARRYDGGGRPVGGEFQINTYTSGFQSGPAVAARYDGSFVVVWANSGEPGILGRLFDRSGRLTGSEFQVSTSLGSHVRPALATRPDGAFVAVWAEAPDRILARRFDSRGRAIGGELQVNTYTGGDQDRPQVAFDSAGNFVVVWRGEEIPYPDYADVFARRFASTGMSLGTEFMVNTYTYFYQGDPAVGAQPDGNFLVVWDGLLDAGDVLARRFAAPHTVIVASEDVPVAIPDDFIRGATSTLLGPDLLIADVNLVIDRLPHACPAHLDARLTSPSGTTVEVLAAFGVVPSLVRTPGFIGTVLDDEAPRSLAEGAPSFSGTFNVEDPSVSPMPFSRFDGENASGVWTLRIADRATGCAGELEAWSLELTPVRCAGDCDRNGIVETSDLVRAVSAALGASPVGSCVLVDGDRNLTVGIDELLLAVSNGLSGCAGDSP